MSEPTGPALPAQVRERVVAYAVEALTLLPAADVPGPLRAVARFAPAKRAKAGAGPLATQVAVDKAFRARVSEVARARQPDLAERLERGAAAADPTDPTGPAERPDDPAGSADLGTDLAETAADTAAMAYLLRPPGWEATWSAAVSTIEQSREPDRHHEQTVARLTAQLTGAREAAQAAAEDQRRAAAEAAAQVSRLRRSVADGRRSQAAAEARAEASEQALAEAQATSERARGALEAEIRRLRERVAAAEAVAENAQRAARRGRTAEDVRLRLLLDTIVGSAAGLRRELALPPLPANLRPADGVLDVIEARSGDDGGPTGPRARAEAADDPAALDRLLELPQVHLLVDGYNVTKSGYGSLPLDAQRERLLAGLAALAAQTSAEVTCVFDGADLDGPVPQVRARGVRVAFSPRGTTADVVLRRLVRQEPRGRAVVVVSTDREVAEGVRAAGAYAVPSAALLRRLGRG